MRQDLPLRRTLLLIVVSVSISLLLPEAPLSRMLLKEEDTERQRLVMENEERIKESERFLRDYKSRVKATYRPPYLSRAASGVDVAITVLTMARGGQMLHPVSYRTQYLTQSLARLLHLLNDTKLTRTYNLQICNVDENPEFFQESRDLESLVPTFQRYGMKSEAGEENDSSPEEYSIWEKLKHDYLFCLDQTLALATRYVMLVEDDALAHEQLLHVLERLLTSVLEARDSHSVAYIKLFHPRRLLGYLSLEVERMPELLALALSLGAILALICAQVRVFCAGDVPAPIGNTPSLASWAGWAAAVGILALAIGRTNLLELRRLSPQLYQVTPTPSCCIPAVLYTRDGASALRDFLMNVTCSAARSTDIVMDEFRSATGSRGLLVQPNLFSHIGLVSTLRTKEVSPLIVQ